MKYQLLAIGLMICAILTLIIVIAFGTQQTESLNLLFTDYWFIIYPLYTISFFLILKYRKEFSNFIAGFALIFFLSFQSCSKGGNDYEYYDFYCAVVDGYLYETMPCNVLLGISQDSIKLLSNCSGQNQTVTFDIIGPLLFFEDLDLHYHTVKAGTSLTIDYDHSTGIYWINDYESPFLKYAFK